MATLRVIDNDDDTLTVVLKRPVAQGKTSVTEVTLRKNCTVNDFAALDEGKGEIDKNARLIARLSEVSADQPGISLSTVQKLHVSDFLLLVKEIGRIMEAEADVAGAEGK